MSELHISQFVFLFFTLLRDIEQHLAPKIYLDARKKYELHSFLMLGKVEKVRNIHTEST